MTRSLPYQYAEKSAKVKDALVNIIRMFGIFLITITVSEVMYNFNLGNQNMVMLYLLAVLVISFTAPNYIYGIVAALISTFAYDFLLTEPRLNFSFTVGLPVTLFIMLLVTIVTSTMAAQMKKSAHIAIERERHAQQLYEINQKLLAARDLDTITALACEYLVGHLHHPAILYTSDPSLPDSDIRNPPEGSNEQVFYTPEQKTRVHELFQRGNQEIAYPVEGGCDVLNIPVVSKGCILGVIGIACKNDLIRHSDLTFVHMLAGQMALALELQYLSDEQRHIMVEAEKEKVRGTLLRSISHDLRTPLTGIFGASSTILEQKGLDAATLERLVTDIQMDAQWLIRMVENILIITRISGDNPKIKKTSEAAEEIVSNAVSIVRKRFPDYTFMVSIPDELLVVPMDGTLISQVLINLLENAVKNSSENSLILVRLKKKDHCAEFDVIDNGCGIPEYLKDSLFEGHPSEGEPSTDASRGMGIGLSICKTIVQAHGGYIEGHNRSRQGARFSFRLPLQEVIKIDE